MIGSGVVWAGANIGYDCACAMAWGHATPEQIFEAYDRGLILDLSVFERLAEIGGWTTRKELSLAMLHRAYGLGELPKGEVRTSYGPLLGRPLSDYSNEQVTYALLDAKAGLAVFERQLARWHDRIDLRDVAAQSRKAFWLNLVRCWGMRTDPGRVDVLEREAKSAVVDLTEIAQEAGFVRDDGSRDMKAIRAAVTEAYEDAPPLTQAKKDRKSKKPFVPQVRTDKDTLISCGDPILESLADLGSWKGIVGSEKWVDGELKKKGDLVFLKAGTVEPIHTKWGIADTLRVTSSKPNLQNIRRAARKDCICGRSSPAYVKACACGSTTFTPRQGIRECFVPRVGHCFVAIDHGGLELATLAQVCVSRLGRYDMASKLNAGEDLHAHVAAQILGIDYDRAIELKASGDKEFANARNCGKVVNFGRPGGMAARTLVLYAKQSYGVEMTLPFAEDLIRHWGRANPDGVAFLRYVRSLRRGERFDVVIPGTNVQRNQTTYCSAANCHFQGLGAALEAHVGWLIAREQFTGKTPQGEPSPLAVARTVNFVHDEFIVETPIGTQTGVARRLEGIMIEGARPFLPNVRITAEYAAMDRWSKSAKAKFNADGELEIWQAAA